MFKEKLKGCWDPKVELCGVISPDQEIISSTNRSKTPELTFEFTLEDLEGTIGTWHSHPSGSANLSLMDYQFYQSWANKTHFIISASEVRCYVVSDGLVYQIEQEKDLSVRPPG